VSRSDVIVVGAGPAGSVTSGLLAQRGWRVTLLERASFPRPKPCGECVNPGAVAALARTGFLDVVMELSPAPIQGWCIGTWEGAEAWGRYDGTNLASALEDDATEARDPSMARPSSPPKDLGGKGLGIARTSFDEALALEAVRRGARLRECAMATKVEIERRGVSTRCRVWTRDGRDPEEARMVVVADGIRSRLARQLGTVRRPPRLRKVSLTCHIRGRGPDPRFGRLRIGGSATVGLASVRAGQDLWNATVVVDACRHACALRDDVRSLFAQQLGRAAFPWDGPPEITEGPLSSGPFDWPSRRAAGAGFVLVGDAAGYYDPLTGQGIYRAVRSAELATEAIDAVLRGERLAPLWHYEKTLRKEVAAGRRVQRTVEWILTSPRLRRILFQQLETAPEAMSRFLRVTGDLDPVRALLRRSAWTPILRSASRLSPGGTYRRPETA
jgi:flavin-dependent dehydrogenase